MSVLQDNVCPLGQKGRRKNNFKLVCAHIITSIWQILTHCCNPCMIPLNCIKWSMTCYIFKCHKLEETSQTIIKMSYKVSYIWYLDQDVVNFTLWHRFIDKSIEGYKTSKLQSSCKIIIMPLSNQNLATHIEHFSTVNKPLMSHLV